MSISIVPNPNGAPVSADYLVGTATGELGSEIVAGTVPGGELGGTWAAPTVDSTHSGSAHHDAVTLAADADVLLSLTGQAIGFDTQTANFVLAGPASGGAADPTFRALVAADIPARTVVLTFIIDGGGAAITTGIKGDLEIPFAMTITGWTALADQSGSIVVDIWKDTYANFPPTVADTITASDKPTISTATKGQDLAPTGWTTAVTAGDILRFNVDSITTCQRVTLAVRGTVP